MLKIYRFICFLLVALTLTLPAFAQRRTAGTNSAKSVQDAKDKVQRQIDEAEIAKLADPGFDAAYVIKAGAIRETPAATGKSLLAVKRGDVLSLVDKIPQANWYKVVQSETGDEGWIDGRTIIIKLTGNTETGPPLKEETAAAANALPEVTVSNLEEKTTLRIRLNGKLYYIQPGTSKTVQVAAGKFVYYGWSPGIRPATGNSVLENGKKYSWTFRIYTR